MRAARQEGQQVRENVIWPCRSPPIRFLHSLTSGDEIQLAQVWLRFDLPPGNSKERDREVGRKRIELASGLFELYRKCSSAASAATLSSRSSTPR